MKNFGLFLLSVAVVATASILFAQNQSSTNMKSPITLQGTVTEVTHPSPYETHVLLQTKQGTQEICLGDSRFLDENGLSPKRGDATEVTGFTSRTEDGTLVVANSLQGGSQNVKLWNAGGNPRRYEDRRGWYCDRYYDHHGSSHHHYWGHRDCCW